MDPQLQQQLAQSLVIAPATGAGPAGDPTYGSQTTVPARIEQVTKMLRKVDGTFVATTHWICLATTVGLNDRLWLPGTDPTQPGQARIPLSVEQLPDERGNFDHCEVLV